MKKEIVYVGGRGDDDDKKGRHHMGQRAGPNETMTRYFIMFSDLLKWISPCKCCLHGYDQLNKKM